MYNTLSCELTDFLMDNHLEEIKEMQTVCDGRLNTNT